MSRFDELLGLQQLLFLLADEVDAELVLEENRGDGLDSEDDPRCAAAKESAARQRLGLPDDLLEIFESSRTPS